MRDFNRTAEGSGPAGVPHGRRSLLVVLLIPLWAGAGENLGSSSLNFLRAGFTPDRRIAIAAHGHRGELRPIKIRSYYSARLCYCIIARGNKTEPPCQTLGPSNSELGSSPSCAAPWSKSPSPPIPPPPFTFALLLHPCYLRFVLVSARERR